MKNHIIELTKRSRYLIILSLQDKIESLRQNHRKNKHKIDELLELRMAFINPEIDCFKYPK